MAVRARNRTAQTVPLLTLGSPPASVFHPLRTFNPVRCSLCPLIPARQRSRCSMEDHPGDPGDPTEPSSQGRRIEMPRGEVHGEEDDRTGQCSQRNHPGVAAKKRDFGDLHDPICGGEQSKRSHQGEVGHEHRWTELMNAPASEQFAANGAGERGENAYQKNPNYEHLARLAREARGGNRHAHSGRLPSLTLSVRNGWKADIRLSSDHRLSQTRDPAGRTV